MKNDRIYKKYPHIVPGSIEETQPGRIIKVSNNNEFRSHGKICVVRCVNADIHPYCMKTRIINVQDAGQVKKCKICIKRDRNTRRKKK